MNAEALSRARATLAELRELLPEHADAIDALARKLEVASNPSDTSRRVEG